MNLSEIDLVKNYSITSSLTDITGNIFTPNFETQLTDINWQPDFAILRNVSLSCNTGAYMPTVPLVIWSSLNYDYIGTLGSPSGTFNNIHMDRVIPVKQKVNGVQFQMFKISGGKKVGISSTDIPGANTAISLDMDFIKLKEKSRYSLN